MNQKSVIDAYWESKSYYTKDYNMWNYTDVPFSLKITFLHSYDINVLKNVNLVARDWWRSSQNLSIFSYIKSRFQMNVMISKMNDGKMNDDPMISKKLVPPSHLIILKIKTNPDLDTGVFPPFMWFPAFNQGSNWRLMMMSTFASIGCCEYFVSKLKSKLLLRLNQ